jgi:hypothetical protein
VVWTQSLQWATERTEHPQLVDLVARGGELDEEELDQMFTQCGITLSTPQCRQVIAYCDAERNGTVSLRELRWLLTAKENVAETLVSNKQTPTKRSTRHCGASPIKLST